MQSIRVEAPVPNDQGYCPVRPRHHGKAARPKCAAVLNERVSSMLNMLDTGDGTGNLVFLFQSVPELGIH
jgi:hypothetical protein